MKVFRNLAKFLNRRIIQSQDLLFPNINYPFPTTFHRYSMFNGQTSRRSKVLVLGSGNFGSCLASHLGDSQHQVYMWARDECIVKHFNKYHRNPMYLVDHQFPPNITAIGPELPGKEITDAMDVVLFAIPTQFLRFLQSKFPFDNQANESITGRIF